VRRVPQREEEESDPGQEWLLEFGADAKDPDKVEEKVKSMPLSRLLTAKICTLLGTTLHTTANANSALGSDLQN
jgi:hypothetical protein